MKGFFIGVVIARDWMVSTKMELLEKYAPLMKSHDENETPIYKDVKYLNRGIKFDPPLL